MFLDSLFLQWPICFCTPINQTVHVVFMAQAKQVWEIRIVSELHFLWGIVKAKGYFHIPRTLFAYLYVFNSMYSNANKPAQSDLYAGLRRSKFQSPLCIILELWDSWKTNFEFWPTRLIAVAPLLDLKDLNKFECLRIEILCLKSCIDL